MNDHAKLLELTAGIASAFVGNNPIAPAEVPSLVSGIFSALSKPFEPAPTPPEPAVPVRSSIKADYIVDLIDGTKHKMLKRHLQTAHGLTPAEYRAMFNLPADYPMVAPNYSETRRRLAKEIGLGRVGNPRRGRRSTEARGRVAAAH